MNPLFLLRNFIKGLIKEKEPKSVALSISFAFIFGIIPKNNLLAQFIFILALVFKTNIPFFIVFSIIFSSLSFILDPITDIIGYRILTMDAFENFFTELYNMPIIPWTDFNNTVVIGGVILGIIVFFPLYIVSKKFSEKYLIRIGEGLASSKLVKTLKLTWLFDWYFKE